MQKPSLNLTMLQDAIERAGGIPRLVEATRLSAGVISRTLSGKTEPSGLTLALLSGYLKEDPRVWYGLAMPVDWQRLDVDSPGVYDTFIDEMMNSKHVIGFGRKLHCYLLPSKVLQQVTADELSVSGLPQTLIDTRLAEEQVLIKDLYDKCVNRYKFDVYRAVGSARSLLETLGGESETLDETVNNLRRNNGRGALGLVKDEEFDRHYSRLREVTGLAHFTSVTVLDTFRVIAWTESGVFFSENKTVVMRVHEYLSDRPFYDAMGFGADWRNPSTRTLGKVTDQVIQHITRGRGPLQRGQ